MSKLKILAGVAIAGMWLFRDFIINTLQIMVLVAIIFAFVGGVSWLLS